MSLTDKDKASEPSFEDVLEELGAVGKFQISQIACCYSSIVMTSFIILSFVFMGYEPHHVCKAVNETSLLSEYSLANDSTASVVYRSCDIQISTNQSGGMKEVDVINCLNGRDFFEAKHTTLLSEWDLVCESSGIAEVSQTLFTIGQMIGGFLGSAVTDRFGRKPVFIGCSLMACLTEFCIVPAPSIYVIYGLKLLSGVFYQALVCCFFVYGMEFVSPRHREANGMIMCSWWVVCTIIVGGVAYFFRNDNWIYFQIGVGISGAYILICPFILHESPRWLAANDRMDETLKILQKASTVNGKDFQRVKRAFNAYVAHAFPNSKYNNNMPMLANGENQNDDTKTYKVSSSEKRPSMFSLIRHPSLRKRTLLAWYLFTTNVLTYFGLYMTSSTLAGDRFLNFMLLNVVEFPSCLFVLIMMKKMSRRMVMEIFFALAAVSLMSSGLLISLAGGSPAADIASTALFIFGKFSITSSFNVIYMVVPELFPTNLRSTASGFCSGMSRVGVLVAPFLRPLFNIVKWGPALIFTVMLVGALIITPFLPETKDVKLLDTVGDVDEEEKEKTTTHF